MSVFVNENRLIKMKCPHCGGNHPVDFKFCPFTGKEIDAHHGMKACSNPDCPDCGKYILPSEAKFCPRCGRPISDDYDAVKQVRSSDSRIVIVCSETAYIKVGKKRDKKIMLKEGENVISVNDCPELKYGFCTEEDGHPEWITKVDLSNYDTSEITDMSSMFCCCSSLESLDLSGFDTSRVVNMSSMFSGCSSLESLDLSGFDTSRVTDMICMFSGCSSLEPLDLSGFDTSRVVRMSCMFSGCSSLKSLDLSCFDTSQVTDMYMMFSGCRSLKSLDLSCFDTSRVTEMCEMFDGCRSLESLDLSGFDTSRVTDMSRMFYGCPKSIQEKYKNFK